MSCSHAILHSALHPLFFAGDGLAPTRMLVLACASVAVAAPDVDALALFAASNASRCASISSSIFAPSRFDMHLNVLL